MSDEGNMIFLWQTNIHFSLQTASLFGNKLFNIPKAEEKDAFEKT